MRFRPFAFIRRINQAIGVIEQMAQSQQQIHDEIISRLNQLKADADAAAARDAQIKTQVSELKQEISDLKQQLADAGTTADFSDVDAKIDRIDQMVNAIAPADSADGNSNPAPTTGSGQ